MYKLNLWIFLKILQLTDKQQHSNLTPPEKETCDRRCETDSRRQTDMRQTGGMRHTGDVKQTIDMTQK